MIVKLKKWFLKISTTNANQYGKFRKIIVVLDKSFLMLFIIRIQEIIEYNYEHHFIILYSVLVYLWIQFIILFSNLSFFSVSVQITSFYIFLCRYTYIIPYTQINFLLRHYLFQCVHLYVDNLTASRKRIVLTFIF